MPARAGFRILKTTNGGADWNKLSGFAFNQAGIDVHFPSRLTGYMLSGRDNVGTFLSTSTSFGRIWSSKRLRQFDEPKLKAIFFTDSLTGYLAGEQGDIIRTTNGGASWQSQSSGLSGTIERLHFLSSTVGFAIGGLPGVSLFLKTTNRGNNWLPQALPLSNRQLRDIWFASPTVGYLAGEAGLILKTTDGGDSWTTQTSGTSAALNSIWFQDINTGFASGTGGTILKTTNGGTGWFRRIMDNGVSTFTDVKCVQNVCYAVGKKNEILWNDSAIMYTSNNMGSRWASATATQPQLYQGWSYRRLYVRSPVQAFLLTTLNRFFEINTIITSLPKPKTNHVALSFDIYPNPSQGGHFTISHTHQTKINMVITDSRGHIIQKSTLDKPKTDMKLRPGLYFVRLENNQGSSVGKVVVY